jgi:hypothetical protein
MRGPDDGHGFIGIENMFRQSDLIGTFSKYFSQNNKQNEIS